MELLDAGKRRLQFPRRTAEGNRAEQETPEPEGTPQRRRGVCTQGEWSEDENDSELSEGFSAEDADYESADYDDDTLGLDSENPKDADEIRKAEASSNLGKRLIDPASR